MNFQAGPTLPMGVNQREASSKINSQSLFCLRNLSGTGFIHTKYLSVTSSGINCIWDLLFMPFTFSKKMYKRRIGEEHLALGGWSLMRWEQVTVVYLVQALLITQARDALASVNSQHLSPPIHIHHKERRGYQQPEMASTIQLPQ